MCRWSCSNLPNGTSTQSATTPCGLIRDTTPGHVRVRPVSDGMGIVSNLDPAPEAINLTPGVVPAVDIVEARKAAIGDGAEVRRLLPQRTLRTIGAWCFLDHYGPDEVSRGPGMRVPPHPHLGLQTVSWLFQGLAGAGYPGAPLTAPELPPVPLRPR